MIVGIGTDVVEIGRVAKTLERFGERFVERILVPEERARFARSNTKANWMAKRFAAKEAFAKAIGTGIHTPFKWHAIEIARHASGKPELRPSPDMARYLASRGVVNSHVSLTDDAGVAVAFVVLEGK